MLKFQPDDAPELPPELPEGQVMARVLPMGHQKMRRRWDVLYMAPPVWSSVAVGSQF